MADPKQKNMALRAVQYHPNHCKEAKEDLLENGVHPFDRFDLSHDLSVIDEAGQRHKIGHFKHAVWAGEIGLLIEKHGLSGIGEKE